jgi:hypothetical protein
LGYLGADVIGYEPGAITLLCDAVRGHTSLQALATWNYAFLPREEYDESLQAICDALMECPRYHVLTLKGVYVDRMMTAFAQHVNSRHSSARVTAHMQDLHCQKGNGYSLHASLGSASVVGRLRADGATQLLLSAI